jgi:histone-lysine N-methyltransferase SETMAR
MTFIFHPPVTLWCKKFKSGVDSVKDAPNARRPKTATLPKMVEKVKDLIATDARFTTRYKVKCVHTILRGNLRIRRISARWIPHLLLTREQKLARVRIAKELLNQFPKYNNRSFANIITDDGTLP